MAVIAPSMVFSSSRDENPVKFGRVGGVVEEKNKGKSIQVNSTMAPTPPSRPSTYHASKEKFLRNFKRFDTVDLHHDVADYAPKQYSKEWVKKVQSEWRILANDLPETIFVRVGESRIDVLRAAIIGTEGTPYHDGLFFFDIYFPDKYPSVPPMVKYHSYGLKINPNLYTNGHVCLSLLGTWFGKAREKWLPNESTVLQLLLSIQALILNEKPYFNEPMSGWYKGTIFGESYSKAYSENVFILSLKTMVYSMRRPPEHFEEFVRSYFFVRAHDIVKACNAYIEGAPVGSILRGGVEDLKQTSQNGSKRFRNDVASLMKILAAEFAKLEVKELEDIPKPLPEITVNIENDNAIPKSDNLLWLFYLVLIILVLVFGILVAFGIKLHFSGGLNRSKRVLVLTKVYF